MFKKINRFNIKTNFLLKKYIYNKKDVVNFCMLNKTYFIHVGNSFHKTKFKYIDLGHPIMLYCFTKKPFCPPVHKILKKM